MLSYVIQILPTLMMGTGILGAIAQIVATYLNYRVASILYVSGLILPFLMLLLLSLAFIPSNLARSKDIYEGVGDGIIVAFTLSMTWSVIGLLAAMIGLGLRQVKKLFV